MSKWQTKRNEKQTWGNSLRRGETSVIIIPAEGKKEVMFSSVDRALNIQPMPGGGAGGHHHPGLAGPHDFRSSLNQVCSYCLKSNEFCCGIETISCPLNNTRGQARYFTEQNRLLINV